MTGERGPCLLLISLGALTGAILEAVARTDLFARIVVASRRPGPAQAKANAVRVGAGIEGRFPEIAVEAFDLGAPDAARRLAEIGRKHAPDLALAAPSRAAWWRVDQAVSARSALAAVPFAGFLAAHLAPMQALRAAWAAAGIACPWIGASYPDVVNAILARTGPAPLCGVGNVAELVPKARMLAAEIGACRPAEIEVRLVAQHAAEYFAYGDGQGTPPPILLAARAGRRDLSAAVRDRFFAPMPIPYDLDFNRFTASATLATLRGLLSPVPVPGHVPAPNGLLGGWPVLLSQAGVAPAPDVPWSVAEAEACNQASLAWDGIASLERDGTVLYTDKTAAALGALLCRPAVNVLRPGDAAGMADALAAAVGTA